LTTYGLIGVKVWVFKGEILNRQEQAVAAPRRRLKSSVARVVLHALVRW
jgi:ribosomal protein S3